MSDEFSGEVIRHKLAARYVQSSLPDSKKPYYLRPTHQQVVGIKEVAALAKDLNYLTPAKTIEDGAEVFLKVCRRLTTEGYVVRTDDFVWGARIPGEYEGTETHLPDGVVVEPRIRPTHALKEYFSRTPVDLDGKLTHESLITEAEDTTTGAINETATMGQILTIRGIGLKVEADDAHKPAVGVFFHHSLTGTWKQADALAVNQPRTLKVIVPATLTENDYYTIEIRTQGTPQGHGYLSSQIRKITSDFTVQAQVNTP